MSLLSKQIDWYLTSHRLYFNHLTAILPKNAVRSCIGIYCCWKASPLVRKLTAFLDFEKKVIGLWYWKGNELIRFS